jgi:hypothetical protein
MVACPGFGPIFGLPAHRKLVRGKGGTFWKRLGWQSTEVGWSMSNALARRLERLEAELARLHPPHLHVLGADDADHDAARKRLIAEGAIMPGQKLVCIETWRWRDAFLGPRHDERKPIDAKIYGSNPARDDTRTQDEREQGCPIPTIADEILAERRCEPEPKLKPVPRWLEYPKGTCPY